MERKTKKVDGVWTAPCKYGKFSYPVISQETIDRLAAYEDTGLEPEEVAAFDRLVALYVEAGLDKNFVLACIEATKAGMTIDRLRELAEADREGRCVVLPRLEPGQGDPIGDKGVERPPGLCPNCNDYRGLVWDKVTGCSRCTICGWTNAKT